MPQFDDIPDSVAQIGGFMLAAGAGLARSQALAEQPPTGQLAALTDAADAISPVDCIAGFGRAVHEHRAVLGADARAMGAAALAFAAQFGWHGLASEAPAMIAELQAAGQAPEQAAG